jgi:Skp family chaperone for outer membrane proteins
MKRLAGVVLLVGLSLADPASAQFYKYLDQQGHIRFTDDINQIPEDQRTKVRRYVESQPAAPATVQTDDSAPKKASTAGTAMEGPTPSAFAAPTADEPLDTLRKRMEEMKAHVEAEYQALVKEKEALDKEKGSQKTRDQVANHNQRVEAFNQRAGKYENRTAELRKQVEDYNARVMEDNAKTPGSANK